MTDERAGVVEVVPVGLRPGEMVRLVGEGLGERGFVVHLPAPYGDDEPRIGAERWGGRCDLSVSDSGFVTLTCLPWTGEQDIATATASVAAFLLTGLPADFRREDMAAGARGLKFLGFIGNALREHGFDVGLDVWEDSDLLEVNADIVVTNPVAGQRSRVRISFDGATEWECDYPSYVAKASGGASVLLSRPAQMADSLVSVVSYVMSVASGREGAAL